MKFTYEHFELNNVLSFKADLAQQDKVELISDKLLEDGLYTTCPKVFKVTEDTQHFDVLLPMNREIENVPDGLDYYPSFCCDKCIYTRYLDFDTDYNSMWNELKAFAEKEGQIVKDIYLVQIPIPGGIVTDVYAEV
ncbi:hypothetical protein SAMN02910298_01961 [Pseudobutyrivibrio sp. YE44]|uniref:hypothetical protein n=1 Tax=Pseudobutyrivibrio sp. YE44 TaxID=1520802 RepID=UPI00088EB61C|nr:hypothetical protein [Pseudobutyrivibrio sp. YE44]SDB40131.1 hypothetical protein SAMN02910298_01961 [Pseudobutyrivibrio sp. YE44]